MRAVRRLTVTAFAIAGIIGGTAASTETSIALADTCSLTMSAPATSTIGSTVTPGGVFTCGGAPVSGVSLMFYRLWDGEPEVFGYPVTGSDGTYAMSVPVTSSGTFGFYTAFMGDSTHGATTSPTATMVVTKPEGALTLAVTTPVVYGKATTLSGHLTASGPSDGRTLYVRAAPYNAGFSTVKTFSPDAAGDFSTTIVPAMHTTYSVVFAGDGTTTAASSPYRVVDVRAALSEALTGYYATSSSYRLYRHAATVAASSHVSPAHAGRCVKFSLQSLIGGAWHAVSSTGCKVLSSTSTARATFHPARGTYRVRAAFGADADHLGNVSPWRYLKVA